MATVGEPLGARLANIGSLVKVAVGIAEIGIEDGMTLLGTVVAGALV